MNITLPNGLLDGGDLFNVAEIDELRGDQQDYLIDKELIIENIGHVPKILGDMLMGLQTESGLPWKGELSEAIYKLPSGDLETILIKIREKTYGPRYFHEAICSHCGHKCKDLELKLDELKLSPLSSEEMLSSKVIFLPKEEVEVELKPAFLQDLMDSVQIVVGKQDTLVTSFLTSSIKRIGDNHNVTREDVGKLRASDIEFIKEKANEMVLEGTIDTDIEIECQNPKKTGRKKECGKEFKVKLNCFDPSFFVPTRG